MKKILIVLLVFVSVCVSAFGVVNALNVGTKIRQFIRKCSDSLFNKLHTLIRTGERKEARLYQSFFKPQILHVKINLQE